MTSKRWPALVFIAACLLGLPRPAGATVIANSTIEFKNLTITPGTAYTLAGLWTLETFAHADNNSPSQNSDDPQSGNSPGSIGSTATVTWASAQGSASAPNNLPDLGIKGSGTSDVNIPGCGSAFVNSNGHGAVFGNPFDPSIDPPNFSFTIIGGTDPVDVTFSIDIAGSVNLMTDQCGLSASTQTTFHLDVDGSPVLFDVEPFLIGPNDALSAPISTHLSMTVPLDPGLHGLRLEADSESSGLNVVPEPPVGVLLLAGLAALAEVRRLVA